MNQSGLFSFEVEMVLAVIAIMIMSIIFYLNVKLLINKTYDVKRLNDIVAISEAISLNIIENGRIPPGIETTEKEIATIDGDCKNVCHKNIGCINLLPSILAYLEIKDLNSLNGYSVQLGESGMITVRSCISRSGEKIEVTR